MVKNVLSTAGYGTRDWLIQRFSAIFMAVYCFALISYIVWLPSINYYDWHNLFANTWVKIATILFVLSLLFHAWIGMWTVFTDYIRSSVLRAIKEALVLIMLAACFFWALMILWSV